MIDLPVKKTLLDLSIEARERGIVPEVDAAELAEMRKSDDPPLVIDVREREEFARGGIPGSYCLPRGVLERDIERGLFEGNASDADLGRQIVLVCGGGHRSLLAGESLVAMGFTDVNSLIGGFGAWANEIGEVAVPQ